MKLAFEQFMQYEFKNLEGPFTSPAWRKEVRENRKLTWEAGELVYLNLGRDELVLVPVFLVKKLTDSEKVLFFKANKHKIKPSLFRQKMWKVIYEEEVTFGLEGLFLKINEEP